MLDRASTFADPEIVDMLKTKFVPVALDQAYQRRQKDTEGDFYRKIAGQGPRSNFENTTQGLYIADAAGKLIAYNNNRGSERIQALMEKAIADFVAPKITPITAETKDPQYHAKPPEGGLVVQVHTKILGGYSASKDQWEKIFHAAIARDNLWITKAEQAELASGNFPPVLAERIARFHLIDNTRGEPPMWTKDEVREIDVKLADGKLSGHVNLKAATGSRGFDAELKGVVKVSDGRVTQFDCVAKGNCWGEGQYTAGAPEGKFPLAVSFRLADGKDAADEIPPQGSRFWLDGYLRPQ